MTNPMMQFLRPQIIPYQELLGNYDLRIRHQNISVIIPYQELLVNHPPQ